MAQLKILNGPNHGRVVSMVHGEVYRMGRDPSLELCIDDTKASRVHVNVEFKEGRWILRDLHSKNGTLVNGMRASTATLQDGDQIQIGETRLGYYENEAPTQSAKPFNIHDSYMAPRVPTGFVPALGNAGIKRDSGDQEGFETLEMNAPLALLHLQGIGASKEIKKVGTDSSQNGLDLARDTPETLDRANRCLRALYTLARTCAEASSVQELFAALSERLEKALEADRVTLLVLDEHGRWQVPDIDPKILEKTRYRLKPVNLTRVPVSKTIVDYAHRTRRSVLTAPREDGRFEGAKSIGEQGITSAMCVPIMSEYRMPATGATMTIEEPPMLGLIYADRLGGQSFDRVDQELLTAASLQAAPALQSLRRLEDTVRQKERLIEELKSQHHMLGECAKVKEVHSFIERAGPSGSTVLVLGESGTGKELVAHAVHYNSPRKDGPMVMVNCAALSESLIESELFGHAKGAFTGATADRVGRFEMAHDGTIFLDEIGELSAACQTKLLRVLEQGEISRVGESRVRKINVRLIAATNRDLGAEVKAGRFREDLFYRLNVISISLPPLRERGDDVRVLLEHYLAKAAQRCGRSSLKFSEESLETLKKYPWPGNVRELRNLTERLAVLTPQDTINVRDLPAEVLARVTAPAVTASASADAVPAAVFANAEKPAELGAGPVRPLAEIEKDCILAALKKCDGNKKLASELLGIDRSTLYAKLRAYGILAGS